MLVSLLKFLKKLSCRRNKGGQQIIQCDCHFVASSIHLASVTSWLEEPGICVILTFLYTLNHSGWWSILSAFWVTQVANPNVWLNLNFHYLNSSLDSFSSLTHFACGEVAWRRQWKPIWKRRGRRGGEKSEERWKKKKIILDASVRAVWINWLFQLVQRPKLAIKSDS